MANTQFQIISSLRFDPELPTAITAYGPTRYPDPHDSPYYLLRYHKDRLLKAAIAFRWQSAIDFLQRDLHHFTHTLDSFIPDRTKAWRLRIVVDSEGRCTVDVHPAAPCPAQTLFIPDSFKEHTLLNSSFPWRLYVDPQRTVPSPFTTHKTTARELYTAARERVGIKSPQDPAEVLLVNIEGDITEGSITTPYFRRRIPPSAHGVHEHWVTPALISGGNAGTTRRYALDHQFCVEQVIRVEELVDGEECWLSNAVRGFIPAVIVLQNTL
jgi:branched-subunit amino acid aminotransferase/4-amino-4-deoxychorismate lyase